MVAPCSRRCAVVTSTWVDVASLGLLPPAPKHYTDCASDSLAPAIEGHKDKPGATQLRALRLPPNPSVGQQAAFRDVCVVPTCVSTPRRSARRFDVESERLASTLWRPCLDAGPVRSHFRRPSARPQRCPTLPAMSASPEEEAKDQENEGEKPELFTQFWMRFEAASRIYQDAEDQRLESIIIEQRDAAYWQGYSDARAGQQLREAEQRRRRDVEIVEEHLKRHKMIKASSFFSCCLSEIKVSF